MRRFWLLLIISLTAIVLGIWIRRHLKYIDIPESNNREIKKLKLKLAESEEENNSWFKFSRPTNCINCGAGLSSRICEYCNTKY